MALHCGDSKNLDFFVHQLSLIDQNFNGESNRTFKDNLWARFRAAAQRIFISEALKARAERDLDEFETYYSDFLDETAIKQLENQYKSALDFSDIDQVFKEAISKSRISQLSELETL